MTEWTPVCREQDLQPERGIAVLLRDEPLAVFRTHAGEFYALHNVDPFSGASVLSRGIVGDHDGEPTVTSPLYKQIFELRTGTCIDDPEISVATHRVRVRDGTIEIAFRGQPSRGLPIPPG